MCSQLHVRITDLSYEGNNRKPNHCYPVSLSYSSFFLIDYMWLRFNFCKYFLSLIYTKTCFSFSILISFLFSYCVQLVWIQSSASVSDFNICTQHLVELNTSHMNFMHIFFVDIVCWFFFVCFLLLLISAEQRSHGSYKKK